MLNVNQSIAEALASDVRKVRLSGTIDDIAFTSDDIQADTFSLTLQSSDPTDFTIGGVYVGQLKFTLINRTIIANLRGELYNTEIKPFFDILVDDEWESIPLGTFYIMEAKHASEGVVITAYDGMSKLDKTFESISLTGTWFELISRIAINCNVQLGFNAAYVADHFINQALIYDLYIENDCATCRDLVYWLAQIVGGFAYFTRDNKLMIKDYGSYEDDIDETFFPSTRSSAKFSDFCVNYQELTLTHIDDGLEYYHNTYSLEPGRVYSLGKNPFLQFEYGYQNYACQSLVEKLRTYQFYPMQLTTHCDPRFELGDHILNSNIRNGGSAVSVIQYINFRFGKGMTIKGYGANEKIGSSSASGGGGESGGTAPGAASSMISISYTNSEALDIGSDEWVEVSRYKFGSVTDSHVMINLMLPIESTLDGDVSIKFNINGEDGDIFTDQIDRGHNLVTVDQNYFFSKNDVVLLRVYAKAQYFETDDRRQTARIIAIEDYINNGGELPEPVIDTTPPSFNIAEYKIRSYLWGRGITDMINFAGILFASDEMNVVFLGGLAVAQFDSEEFDVDLVQVAEIEESETMNEVGIDGLLVPLMGNETINIILEHIDAVTYVGETHIGQGWLL